MKPVWIGIAFFLVYGLFSMKTQAAEGVFAAHTGLQESGDQRSSPCVGE
jgi:hypothetical protein